MLKRLPLSLLGGAILGLVAFGFFSLLEERFKASVNSESKGISKSPQTLPEEDSAVDPRHIQSERLLLQDGGMKRSFEIANDEIHIRLADGRAEIRSLPKLSGLQNFAAEIRSVRSETGVEPELVLYPVGATRNQFTRRILTREVVVSAPTRAEADALAAEAGLIFKKSPSFMPGRFVYEAPTSAGALAAQKVSSTSSAVSASPLLASLSTKRLMPNDQLITKQWHLKFQGQPGSLPDTDVNVETVWKYPNTKSFVFASGNAATDYIRGNNITIGIVDDGLEWSHPDLAPNVIKALQYDWNGKDNDPKPNLWNGDDHGTACAGVAAARGNNKIGVSGVAPEANLVGMRLIAGPKTDLDEAEAITWHPDAIHILSNSWGPADSGDILRGPDALTLDALKYAADFGRNGKGTIITWAGGNGLENEDNSNYDGYANSIYTIAVAAVDSLGLQAYYSEPGANLVVAAPSNGSSPALGILTTDNKGDFGYNPGFQVGDLLGHPNNTETFGGTSSATPAVSGVIALMLQRNPNLGWRDVQEILMRSAAQVDALDPDWITANRTDHVTGNSTASFQFNHKYGAGLVDAAAAVAFSGNWTNLGPQKFLFASNNTTTPIAAGATVNRTFSINGTNLRTEHVTLEVTLTDIPKGDLTVTLTSPGNTTSTFCELHSDTSNTLNRWKFMTVRNWAEDSNGNWTLSITNNGTATGNLTEAELVVYGSELGSTANPAPVVTLESSRIDVFVGASLELTATAIDQNADGSKGSVASLEAFFSTGNATQSLGISANGTWTLTAQQAGNFTLTVNATDSQGLVKSSPPVSLRVTNVPLAAWDFDTTAQSPVPLATALQSVRRYAANFGSGTLVFDGTFNDSQLVPTNRWDFNSGQIFSSDGTAQNAIADMVARDASNEALLLRGGKNLGAQDKGLVFQFSMANQGDLNVTYAANTQPGGFSDHAWSWSRNGTTWTPITTLAPSSGFSQLTLPTITQLGNQTTAYLRVDFSGATAASGTNALDNIIFSATPITPPTLPVSPFLSVAKNSTAKGSSDTPSNSLIPSATSSHSANELIAPASWMEWSAPVVSDYQMIIHAEIVDGAVFLQSPGSLLSAHFSDSVVGLAEPVSGSHRYELRIYRPEATQIPLELKFYNPETQSFWTVVQPVLFQSATTLGTPTQPVRYQVVRPPSNPAPVNTPSHYGIWMNLPPNAFVTMDWIDTDNDGIDDRRQPGSGQPISNASFPRQSSGTPPTTALTTQSVETSTSSKKASKKKKTARKSKLRKS